MAPGLSIKLLSDDDVLLTRRKKAFKTQEKLFNDKCMANEFCHLYRCYQSIKTIRNRDYYFKAEKIVRPHRDRREMITEIKRNILYIPTDPSVLWLHVQ